MCIFLCMCVVSLYVFTCIFLCMYCWLVYVHVSLPSVCVLLVCVFLCMFVCLNVSLPLYVLLACACSFVSSFCMCLVGMYVLTCLFLLYVFVSLYMFMCLFLCTCLVSLYVLMCLFLCMYCWLVYVHVSLQSVCVLLVCMA